VLPLVLMNAADEYVLHLWRILYRKCRKQTYEFTALLELLMLLL